MDGKIEILEKAQEKAEPKEVRSCEERILTS